ncbi:MAG: type II toxin-antitoxin system PemK/MazF family toxin [Treponema sp.]|jgi:mRNA interferase MazF|nr:type II toxin-antitoxin system PemK/MazF family toxin [Treponema sp.]
MKRGELYRVYRGSRYDSKDHRVFLVVSRQPLIDNTFSSVICAPVYSNYRGFKTQVEIGVEEGMKHDSAVYCDELISIPKSLLTNYVGALPAAKMEEVNAAFRIALAV